MVVVVAEPEDKSDWAASIAEGSAAGSGQVQYPFLSYITDGAIQFYRSSLGGGGGEGDGGVGGRGRGPNAYSNPEYQV